MDIRIRMIGGWHTLMVLLMPLKMIQPNGMIPTMMVMAIISNILMAKPGVKLGEAMVALLPKAIRRWIDGVVQIAMATAGLIQRPIG
jgi:putative Ca2+/H+ antiporter (TMEM165/GDT1 family)